MNPIAMSTGALPGIIGKLYCDIDGILEAMQGLWDTGLIDGFEFQNLGEWIAEVPPRERAERRRPRWEVGLKYTTAEIAGKLLQSGLKLLSIHANRDVGIYLCEEKPKERDFGIWLLRESLALTTQLKTPICVVHLWDTWKKKFDHKFLKQTLKETVTEYPGVKAAIENIPVNIRGCTPFELVQSFEFVTLDLRWAAMYDELEKFEEIKDRIVNIHLRGALEDNKWVLHNAPFSFEDALEMILNKWEFPGLLTIETEGGLHEKSWEELVAAMEWLRKEC